MVQVEATSPVCVCLSVCVSEQQIVNKMTFDPDIWHAGLS